MWCEFGANLVQHSMRQHKKYQTIFDYTPHNIPRYERYTRCKTPLNTNAKTPSADPTRFYNKKAQKPRKHMVSGVS